MTMTKATIITAEGGSYRVSVGGANSALIPAVRSAYRLHIDFDAKKWEERPPVVGDQVLCFFPSGGLVDGTIIGILEE